MITKAKRRLKRLLASGFSESTRSKNEEQILNLRDHLRDNNDDARIEIDGDY